MGKTTLRTNATLDNSGHQTRQHLNRANTSAAPAPRLKERTNLRPTANSTTVEKAVHSRALVSSSRKGSELTIEALYVARLRESGPCPPRHDDELPDEGERARMISDITRLIREPHMPESTRCAGLTLIGWLARRMPGESAHALGVSEARQSERRIRSAQQRKR
jgi:hypothetical protein